MNAVRHGDVILVQVEEFDQRWSTGRDFDEVSTPIVLAEGEITGHSHQLVTNDVEMPIEVAQGTSEQFGAAWFLEVPEAGATLTHEEHNTIPLNPGKWIAFQQREAWTDRGAARGFSERRVFD